MYPLKIKEATLTFFVYTVKRMGYSDMPLILNFMETIGYMRSSSIRKAKLLYCTNTNTHQYTAKFMADSNTGIGIGASLHLW